MPVLFIGHGSPMIAIEENEITRKFKDVADYIIDKYQKPRAILMISAHWYTNGNFVQKEQNPKQIYDMYGFPKELYEVKYDAKGDSELSDRVLELMGDDLAINNEWGIDHGAWSVLVHMFPKADIPVVQFSVNRKLYEYDIYEIGKKLEALRDEGYLIIGSGNVVHNLARVEWNNEGGSEKADKFDEDLKELVLAGDYTNLIKEIKKNENYIYAAPSKDHFFPLLYVLGAIGESDATKVTVFNSVRNLGAISMTSYLFE